MEHHMKTLQVSIVMYVCVYDLLFGATNDYFKIVEMISFHLTPLPASLQPPPPTNK